MLLPHFEEVELFKEFHHDEPWNSEHNKKFLSRMPAVFSDPRMKLDPGMTVYQAVVGPGMIFDSDKLIAGHDIKDGANRTVAVVEVAPDRAVPWTKPEDWEVDLKDPLKGLADIEPEGTFQALFLDVHALTIKRSIKRDLLKALFTRDAGDDYDPESIPQVPTK